MNSVKLKYVSKMNKRYPNQAKTGPQPQKQHYSQAYLIFSCHRKDKVHLFLQYCVFFVCVCVKDEDLFLFLYTCYKLFTNSPVIKHIITCQHLDQHTALLWILSKFHYRMYIIEKPYLLSNFIFQYIYIFNIVWCTVLQKMFQKII